MRNTVGRSLLLSVGFTCSLILFRIIYSGSFMYLFLMWNIFLAAVPLRISGLLVQMGNEHFRRILFAAWLLFFPNALYILTDLVHLKERNFVPLWFDAILIFSAALNGLMLAYLSLSQVEAFLHSKFNDQKTKIIISGCLVVSTFGVYVGRFLRWNSWDILFNSFGLAFELSQHVINPFQHPRTWSMTILLSVFFTLFYFILKKLPRIINHPGK